MKVLREKGFDALPFPLKIVLPARDHNSIAGSARVGVISKAIARHSAMSGVIVPRSLMILDRVFRGTPA
jgi:hypothetical protein